MLLRHDDTGGLDLRRWLLTAGAWSLLLTPWLVVAATLDAAAALRVALVPTGARTRAEAARTADERGWL